MEYRDEVDWMRERNRRRREERKHLRREEEDVPQLDVIEFENLEAGRRPSSQRKKRSGKPTAPAQESARERRRKRLRRKRRILLAEILILLLLAAGVFLFYRWKTDSGYWTIAVFGVDSRDGIIESGTHSDVEMICVINKGTGEIRLVSVYRDTYLQVSEDGKYHKINQAYFDGGHEQAVEALNRNLDLEIDDYATFNWKAVADAITILGGIDLEISDSEFEYINSFITETVESTGLGSHHLEHAGMNHLDGVQAVAYARLRLMDTDYNRTARQRLVISLAMEKAKQADAQTLLTVVNAVLPQISTSIGIDDVLPLAKNITRYHIGESGGFPFSRGEANIGKKDCVIPLTLESNVIQLHQFLYDDMEYVPSEEVKAISARIAEDSGMGEVAENAPEVTAGGASSGSSSGQEETQPAPETAAETETVPETLEEETEPSEESESSEGAEESESDSLEPSQETSKPAQSEPESGYGPGYGPGSGIGDDSTEESSEPGPSGPSAQNPETETVPALPEEPVKETDSVKETDGKPVVETTEVGPGV